MSPGLAKRITVESNDLNSNNSYNNNKKINPKQQSSQKLTTEIANNNAQIKIQNALERNMQKLKLHSNKLNNNKQQTTNLSREDLELFSTPTTSSKLNANTLSSVGNNDYFTSDSLSSTPEHINNNNNNTTKKEQLDQNNSEMTAYFLDQLPLPFNLDKNKNSAREMTPDSIDNDEFTKKNQRRQHHHHHHHQHNPHHHNNKQSLLKNNNLQNNPTIGSLTSSCSSSSSISTNNRQKKTENCNYFT